MQVRRSRISGAVRGKRPGELIFVLLLSGIVFSGCGGFVRSRFPDPNASGVPSVSVGIQSASEPSVTGDVKDEASVAEAHSHSLLPEEKARVLEWGFWRASEEDQTKPSSEERFQLLRFADHSRWETLSQGDESAAMGVVALKKQNMEKPETHPLQPGVSGAQPLYLVIAGTFAGLPVTQATYELEVRDHLNQPVILREPRLARRDPEDQRWFTPLSAVIGEQAQQWVQPGHLFRVHWNLEVNHTERFRVTTSFRLRLPPPEVTRLGAESFARRLQLAAGDTHWGSRVLHEERWRNPSRRPTEFWFKLQGEGLGEWHHVVRRSPELKHQHSPEIRWQVQDLQAVARFDIGEVQVAGAILLGRAETDGNQGWIRVLAGPEQEFTVRWTAKAIAASFSSGQVFERRRPRELTWGEWRTGGCGPGAECDRLIPRKVQATETWSPVASRLFGKLRIAVQLVDELSALDLQSEAEVRGETVRMSLAGLSEAERTRGLWEESFSGGSPGGQPWPVWNGADGDPAR